MQDSKLRILSIFLTVDGEVNAWGQGGWSIFIRTAGCGVGCVWCDTKYSWNTNGGEAMSADDILRVVQGMSDAKGVRKVTITGGEPLEQDQRELALLMGELMDHGYHITVETAGTQNTLKFRADHEDLLSNRRFGQLTFIVDYKLPSSKFVGSMDIADHFSHLKRGDVVKFVISDEYDFAEATRVAQILDASWPFRGKMFFSPNHDEVHPHQLLEWMRDAKMQDLDVGLNLQLHKYIFPDDVRDEENTGVDFTKRTLGRDAYLDKIRESKDA